MDVSLVTFTITIVVEFRTFFIGIQRSFVILLRHVDSLPRCWVDEPTSWIDLRSPSLPGFFVLTLTVKAS